MSYNFSLPSTNETMFLSALFFTLSISCLSIFIFSLVSKRRRTQLCHHGRETLETNNAFVSVFTSNTASSPDIRVDNQDNIRTDFQGKTSGSDPNQQLSRSLLLDILPSDSSKWAQLFSDDIFGKKGSDLNGFPVGIEEEEEEEEEKKIKKKKKRGKKKRPDRNECSEKVMKKEKKEELVCFYPFTTSTSATQRKIKQQYDQLVKSHESDGLTLAQVGRFINCLVESKKELEHRSEVTQRKFTIAKALLLKADRSSFDRISQQIYKLESEQKRIEEDAFVYNWLQQQLKLSPAYKKMLEISTFMEMKAKSCEKAENMENETDDISFEELLAQEKKDAFWQRRKI